MPCLFGDGSHYLEGELDNNIAVQLDAGGVLAKLFERSDVDELVRCVAGRRGAIGENR